MMMTDKRKREIVWPALLLLALILAAGSPPALFAAPAQQTNLLQNPGLEQPFTSGVAQGWTRWFRQTEKSGEDCLTAYHYQPKWNIQPASTDLVRQGTASQYVGNNWDTWSAGIFQTVPATAGTRYRFTFSARGRGSNEPSPAGSESGLNMNIRAGIDPNGSGLWNDADVVWGAAGSPHDAWQQFTVEATATGNQITVFTYADWGVTGVNQCRQFMDTWYDAAELIVAAAPTNTPAPQPTQAPLPTATQPPAATQPAAPTPTLAAVPTEAAAATLVASLTPPAEATAATGGGTICVNAFLDENGNGLHESNEGYVTGVTLTVAQGDLLIGQAVSTGTDDPICFPGLATGSYQVAQSVPALLEMTTQANASIDVAEGQTLGLEFGSRLRPPGSEAEATATAGAVSEVNPTPTLAAASGGEPGGLTPAAIGGLAAIALGIILLGVLIFYIVRR
jgi:hypothetical protein